MNQLSPPPMSQVNQLRAYALGPQLVQWCDKTAPELQTRFDKTAKSHDRLQAELDLDLNDIPDSITDPEARANELQRLTSLHERLTASLERQVNIHMKLTAGGQASLWASFQTAKASPAQTPEHTERDATPRRRYGSGAALTVVDAADANG